MYQNLWHSTKAELRIATVLNSFVRKNYLKLKVMSPFSKLKGEREI